MSSVKSAVLKSFRYVLRFVTNASFVIESSCFREEAILLFTKIKLVPFGKTKIHT